MKPIMIQGTASGVGKTTLALALCRIFKQDGHNVAPFKAQNMTENTCHTKDGEEIAISQWLQAKAAGVTPCKDMNPIVLKPPFAQNINPEKKLEIALQAYKNLSNNCDIMVIEGAGSPVELNLNQYDIVNMGLATRIAAPVVLVADIDRGGVFASLYGTLTLMKNEERLHVKAAIINRFMGKANLFAEGISIIEDITKLPVAGVVPYIDIGLPQEDGLFDNGDVDFDINNSYEEAFDRIAGIVRKSLNMELIYKILQEPLHRTV